jgi:hypothetical protein
LVAGRELSFLYKGRGLRRPQQLELGSVEVYHAEDATAQNFQDCEGDEENVAAETHYSRFRVHPGPDGEEDPSTILEARGDA